MPLFKKSKPRPWAWLRISIPTAAITLFAALITANLGDQQKDIDYRITEVAAIGEHQFQLTMENMLGPTFTHGNQVTAYQNGDQIFPAMLAAIRQAQKTINFESYIYVSGKVGDQFVEALSERARSGV